MALYVVSTPVGNLEDITLRAVRILKEADVVASEDTRHTKKLLTHYGIKTRQTSYHEHNERAKADELVRAMQEGADVALVTDAGTPGISDPGYRLVCAAVEAGVPVVAVPGPSAVVGALSVAALPTDEFTFKGFVPTGAAARKRLISALAAGAPHTFVMYESPRRLLSTLRELERSVPGARVAVVRELTKVHEEVVRGTPAECLAEFKEREPRGEITLVVRVDEAAAPEGPTLEEELQRLLEEGHSVRDASAMVAAAFGTTRREAYALALKLGRKGGT